MYQALLTRRYLTSKIVPFVGVGAVALCSLLVLTTWSIMGGFLNQLLETGRDMEGDVTIAWPTVGFAHYEELIRRLEKDPAVVAACPIIETFGIVTLPDGRRPGISIKGVDARYSDVTNYAQALWWKPITQPLRKDKDEKDPRLNRDFKDGLQVLYEDGKSLSKFDPLTRTRVPAVVPGIELSNFSIRKPAGYYLPGNEFGMRTPSGEFKWVQGFLPGHRLAVTILPLTQKATDLGVVQQEFPVANEFRTGLYEADKNTMLMDLAALQRMLKMDAWEKLEAAKSDPYTIEHDEAGREIAPGDAHSGRKVIGIEPARVTAVLVKGAYDITPDELRDRCVQTYAQFAADFPGQVPTPENMHASETIATFAMQRATFIAAVKQETAIVLLLLIVVSFVAASLILSIFWAMVAEKTKDIGTLRAVGASQAGVAWLWLRYGMVIGVVGAGLGILGACLLVWNINPIHEWLYDTFEVSVWDPKVYYFAQIPSKVEPARAGIVAAGAIAFSLVGALIPALRAALMDPVKALRFE